MAGFMLRSLIHLDLSFVFFKDLFIYYVYSILSILSACMPAGQKRAPDLITDVVVGNELRTFGRAGNALNH